MKDEGDVASEGRLVGKLYSWGKCTMVLIGVSLSDPFTRHFKLEQCCFHCQKT